MVMRSVLFSVKTEVLFSVLRTSKREYKGLLDKRSDAVKSKGEQKNIS
jgi:hypothetical protein